MENYVSISENDYCFLSSLESLLYFLINHRFGSSPVSQLPQLVLDIYGGWKGRIFITILNIQRIHRTV